ncbi:MAG TPA: cyanophycin synthetase, partial [candidate division Zixibacteria bacterium]|nr:cyanophycin synthetase [candidate division Zixibacteria bacterium]
PDAISRAIEAAQQIRDKSGRVIALFGCGGDRDAGKRPLMGQAASRADITVVTSDNPRSESPAAIIDQIMPGVTGESYTEINRRDAIARAFSLAREGDVVLLLGKGAERYEVDADGRRPYSEVDETQKALAALGFTSPVAPRT